MLNVIMGFVSVIIGSTIGALAAKGLAHMVEHRHHVEQPQQDITAHLTWTGRTR